MSGQSDPNEITYGEPKSEPHFWAVKAEETGPESRVGSPAEYDSVLDFSGSDSGSENDYGSYYWCQVCRIRCRNETSYYDHLKLHVKQPYVRLSKIDINKAREPSNSCERKPIRLKLKKLNSSIEGQSAFATIPRPGTPSLTGEAERTLPTKRVKVVKDSREAMDIKKEVADDESPQQGDEGNDHGGGVAKGTADEDSTGDSGVASPLPPAPGSPTPSEILRPRGYMAPSPPDRSLENGSLSPMSCISTASTVLFNPNGGGGDEGATLPGDSKCLDLPHNEKSNSSSSSTHGSSSRSEKEEDLDGDSQDASIGHPIQPKSESVDTSSPTIGNITVRSAAELLSPQGLINSSDNSVAADTFQALQGLVSDVQTNEGLKVLSPVDMGLLNGNSSAGATADPLSSYSCDVCGESAPSRQALEMHKASSAHYRCPIGPDCPMFPSAMELASHYHAQHSGVQQQQQQVSLQPPPHQQQQQQAPPVHQLQQQVQRLQQVLPGGVTLVTNRGGPPPYQQHQQQQQQKAPNSALRPQVYTDHPYSQYSVLQQGQTPPSLANLPPGVQVSHSQSPPPPQLVNLPPGVQVSKRPATPGGGGPSAKQRRQSAEEQDNNGQGLASPQIKLPDSITLMRPGVSITSSSSQKSRGGSSANSNGSDASSVANMLATRGITVVPSSGGRSNGAGASARRNSSPQQSSSPVVANLNSAVSITPSPQRAGSNFAVPGRSGRGQNPAKLPTVDLTQEMPQPLPPPPPPARPPVPQPMVAPPQPPPGVQGQQGLASPGGRMGGRGAGRAARVTCQVCDKMFANPEALAVHMHSHRQPGQNSHQPLMNNSPRSASKLPYECNLCTAQYPTQQGLMSHKQKYHNEPGEGPELVLPVVDLKQPGTLQRLAGLGIRHFLPLAQLHNQSGGMYGLPIVSVDSARNPAVCNIGGIGASNLFPLGPMKSLR